MIFWERENLGGKKSCEQLLGVYQFDVDRKKHFRSRIKVGQLSTIFLLFSCESQYEPFSPFQTPNKGGTDLLMIKFIDGVILEPFGWIESFIVRKTGVFFINSFKTLFNGIQYSMLSQSTIDQCAENRRAEKPMVSVQEIYLKIDAKQYEMVIQWVMDAANELKLTSSTRYLTRIYLDLLFHNSPTIYAEDYIPLTVTSLSLAIKFNELRGVADIFTPQYLFQMANLEFSGDFYWALENKIMSALKFRFKYTTPYDYIDAFCQRFPWHINFKNALTQVLNVTLALPCCASFSAEEIFYATVQTIFRAKQVILTPTQKSVLLGLTDTWERAAQLSGLILHSISEFFAL